MFKNAFKQYFPVFLLIVLLFLLGSFINPGFSSFSNIGNIVGISAFLGIVAMGQTLVVISGNEGIDLSVGSLVSLSAVLSSQLIVGNNLRLLIALPVVLGTGAFFGVLNGIGIAYVRIPPVIMTLGMGSLVQGFVQIVCGGQPTGRASNILLALGTGRSLGFPNMLFFWLGLSLLFTMVLRYSRFGQRIYGIGANPVAAFFSGTRIAPQLVLVYTLSALMATVAGFLLLGYTGTSHMDLGAAYTFPSIIAVVIGGISLQGGKGSYGGVLLGATFLTALSSLLVTLNLGEGGRQIVYGIALLILLLVYAREESVI
ncbi:MAG: ABC transporter permease [Atribacterota bacterium]